MEFTFNVEHLLRADENGYTIIESFNKKYLPEKCRYCMNDILNNLGNLSSIERHINPPLTTSESFFNSQNNKKVIIKIHQNLVIGFLVFDYRKIMLRNYYNLNYFSEILLTVSDFYICRKYQRRHYGKEMFDKLIYTTNIKPVSMAFEFPNRALTNFLNKNYAISGPISQPNNIITYCNFDDKTFNKVLDDYHRPMDIHQMEDDIDNYRRWSPLTKDYYRFYNCDYTYKNLFPLPIKNNNFGEYDNIETEKKNDNNERTNIDRSNYNCLSISNYDINKNRTENIEKIYFDNNNKKNQTNTNKNDNINNNENRNRSKLNQSYDFQKRNYRLNDDYNDNKKEKFFNYNKNNNYYYNRNNYRNETPSKYPTAEEQFIHQNNPDYNSNKSSRTLNYHNNNAKPILFNPRKIRDSYSSKSQKFMETKKKFKNDIPYNRNEDYYKFDKYFFKEDPDYYPNEGNILGDENKDRVKENYFNHINDETRYFSNLINLQNKEKSRLNYSINKLNEKIPTHLYKTPQKRNSPLNIYYHKNRDFATLMDSIQNKLKEEKDYNEYKNNQMNNQYP